MPVGMPPPHFCFISWVVIYNNMTLKPLIWWKNRIFSPFKLKKNTEWSLKCACRSAACRGTECPLKGHWTMPEIRISGTFCEHSVDIHKCFSWLKLKENFHPVAQVPHDKNPSLLKCQDNVLFLTALHRQWWCINMSDFFDLGPSFS